MLFILQYRNGIVRKTTRTRDASAFMLRLLRSQNASLWPTDSGYICNWPNK